MLTIRRSCSYRIITRAVNAVERPLVALLLADAVDCEPCLDASKLQAAVQECPQAIIVYNQHAEAVALVASLELPENQIYIEIRQDTKGVLGLHALRRCEVDNETLELIYQ